MRKLAVDHSKLECNMLGKGHKCSSTYRKLHIPIYLVGTSWNGRGKDAQKNL